MAASDRAAVTIATVSQAQARLAGFLYLTTIAAGLFAEIFVRSALTVRGNGAATAANIAANRALYRAGEVADLAMLCCYLAVTVLLYRIFAGASRSLSATAAVFSMTGIAVLAGDGLLHMAPLVLLDGELGPGWSTIQRDGLINLSLDLHGDVYAISLVFFGIYCTLIGWLAIRTKLLPPAVGGLMIVGGVCHVVTKVAFVLSPELAHLLPRLMSLAPLLGEATLAVWLIIFGVREDRMDRQPVPGR